MEECNCNICKEYQNGIVCTFCDDGSEFERMSKGDKIRAMSDEELAEFLFKVNAASKHCMTEEGDCKWEDYPTHDKGCKDCFLEWLKSEVKE